MYVRVKDQGLAIGGTWAYASHHNVGHGQDEDAMVKILYHVDRFRLIPAKINSLPAG
jgi:hypothetical protein